MPQPYDYTLPNYFRPLEAAATGERMAYTREQTKAAKQRNLMAKRQQKDEEGIRQILLDARGDTGKARQALAAAGHIEAANVLGEQRRLERKDMEAEADRALKFAAAVDEQTWPIMRKLIAESDPTLGRVFPEGEPYTSAKKKIDALTGNIKASKGKWGQPYDVPGYGRMQRNIMTGQEERVAAPHTPPGQAGREKTLEIPITRDGKKETVRVSTDQLKSMHRALFQILTTQQLMEMEYYDPKMADAARKRMAEAPDFFDWVKDTYGIDLSGGTKEAAAAAPTEKKIRTAAELMDISGIK